MAPSGGATKPFWSCGKCAFEDNWACKERCHGCGAGAPTKAKDKARELARRKDDKDGKGKRKNGKETGKGKNGDSQGK